MNADVFHPLFPNGCMDALVEWRTLSECGFVVPNELFHAVNGVAKKLTLLLLT